MHILWHGAWKNAGINFIQTDPTHPKRRRYYTYTHTWIKKHRGYLSFVHEHNKRISSEWMMSTFRWEALFWKFHIYWFEIEKRNKFYGKSFRANWLTIRCPEVAADGTIVISFDCSCSSIIIKSVHYRTLIDGDSHEKGNEFNFIHVAAFLSFWKRTHFQSEVSDLQIIILFMFQLCFFPLLWEIHHWFPKKNSLPMCHWACIGISSFHLNGNLDIYLIESIALLQLFIKNRILFLFKMKWLQNLMETKWKWSRKNETEFNKLIGQIFIQYWMGERWQAQSNNILAFLKLLNPVLLLILLLLRRLRFFCLFRTDKIMIIASRLSY